MEMAKRFIHRSVSRKVIEIFTAANKGIMYDLLKREDINWRECNRQAVKDIYRINKPSSSRIKAFVLNDSIKTRRGKKMDGVSNHFDHLTSRHVRGQQGLTLRVMTEEAFLPLDSQRYVRQTRAKGLIWPYKDGRSVVAKRYH